MITRILLMNGMKKMVFLMNPARVYQKGFSTMANYNKSIYLYLSEDISDSIHNYEFKESTSLRYGENPIKMHLSILLKTSNIEILQIQTSYKAKNFHTIILLMLMLHF